MAATLPNRRTRTSIWSSYRQRFGRKMAWMKGRSCVPCVRRTIDKHSLSWEDWALIQRLKGRGLRRLYSDGETGGVRSDLVPHLERILSLLDSAETPQALSVPSLRLHALKGDKKGYWAVTVRANWRVVFRFQDGDVWDVELIDYH
jgi:proteic killer suppression protein